MLTNQETRIRVDDLVDRLVAHPLYRQVSDENKLKIFMRSHVFCVWDFQSLLKALQRQLTCVEVPWLPTSDPDARRLINEIVLEEESDRVGERYLSHFELYLEAMNACGADQGPIQAFMASLRSTRSVEKVFEQLQLPKGVKSFVRTTLSIAQSNQVHRIAAAFTYGREDIIPQMFQPLALQLTTMTQDRWSVFLDYLERHIKHDGERHGPMSRALLKRICGEDERLWAEAEETARVSLEARLELWDALLSEQGIV